MNVYTEIIWIIYVYAFVRSYFKISPSSKFIAFFPERSGFFSERLIKHWTSISKIVLKNEVYVLKFSLAKNLPLSGYNQVESLLSPAIHFSSNSSTSFLLMWGHCFPCCSSQLKSKLFLCIPSSNFHHLYCSMTSTSRIFNLFY